MSGVGHRVAVEQLERDERNGAWADVIARAPDFDGYTSKTDRPLPILRLTPTPRS